MWSANGKEAVDALRSLPYDLVLMDCQMPEMDGYEATARIRDPRSSVRDHGVPVIAMTAHAMKADRDKCLSAGMNDYVSKPVKAAALVEVLERWLPKRTDNGDFASSSEPSRSETVASSKALAFDKSDLVERMMGDNELAREVVDCFLQDTPAQIAALREHLNLASIAVAARFAHSIRGAAANVSAQALSAIAAELEISGAAGDLASVLTQFRELEKEFEAARDAMQSTRL